VRRWLAVILFWLVVAGCSDGDDTASVDSEPPASGTVATADVGAPDGEATADSTSASDPTMTGAPGDTEPIELGYEVLGSIPHDTTAFTQGLLLTDDGRIFEATGYDSGTDGSTTTVREVDPDTGEVLRAVSLGRDFFGEGLALVDDRLIQLTWTEHVAFVYDIDTFEQVGSFAYDGEGWGLCHDEAADRLVMSNGSASLTFRDPDTFAPLGEVLVVRDGEPVERLNELECAEGAVWANVWQTDEIMRIDPASGVVTGVLDLGEIISPDPADANGNAVLNGIAYDEADDTYLVTGKLWPTMYEIRLTE
jgi:glutaminyl-peptide cyclotransferase